jgi:hypothetical protein
MIFAPKSTLFIINSLLFLPILALIGVVFLGIDNPLKLIQIVVILNGIWVIMIYKKEIKIPIYSYFLLAFVLYEYLWSFQNGLAQGRFLNLSYIYGSSHFALFIISILIHNMKFDDKIIRRAIAIFKITIILSAVATLIQFYFPNFINYFYYVDRDSYGVFESNLYTNRRSSIFGFIDRNSIGFDFLPIISLLISFFIVNKNKNIYLFLVLGAIVAFGSNARYVMIGFILISIQFLLSKGSKIRSFLLYFFSIIIIILFLNMLGKQLNFNVDVWISERLFVENSIEETERFKSYYTFLTFFPDNPIFGTGAFSEKMEIISELDGSSNIHMGYLRYLVIYGVFGCLLLFGSWFLILIKFLRTAKSSGFWGSFFSMIVFLWAFATFYESSLFFYGLIYSFIFDKYYSDKYANKVKEISVKR